MTPAAAPASSGPGLIADIGGTNARFALALPGGGWTAERVLRVADHGGPAEAAAAYLAEVAPETPPRRGAFCVACPVLGDRVTMTNAAWDFSVRAVQAALGLDTLRVVNDFVANALACPRLGPRHLETIGGGSALAEAPIAAIGPGTGLGVALLVPSSSGLVPVATEGGHVTLAAADDREAAVLALLRRDWDHVSAERVVSGLGLPLLHQAVGRLDGHQPVAPPPTPSEITAAALAGDPWATETLTLFCGFLGGTAGNLALTTGAAGGVYLLGGILPAILPFLRASPFRDRFEAKGRFGAYLARIPTWVVTHPYPAFLGLEGLCRGTA
jgi:glucokinase